MQDDLQTDEVLYSLELHCPGKDKQMVRTIATRIRWPVQNDQSCVFVVFVCESTLRLTFDKIVRLLNFFNPVRMASIIERQPLAR
jgi:hypothetical protein